MSKLAAKETPVENHRIKIFQQELSDKAPKASYYRNFYLLLYNSPDNNSSRFYLINE